MGKGSKWDERKADIQRMVNAGKTDVQIGTTYGVSGVTICQARKRLGILSKFKPGPRNTRAVFAAQDPAPQPLVGETYTDEAGQKVTRYPARYAAGALLQSCTARPRRG